MIGAVPKSFFLVSGSGEASNPLNAFDAALLQAGIGDTNLVKMSSILPPGAKEVPPCLFPKGTLVAVAYGELTCDRPGTRISAAVAVGIPEEPDMPGLIMEFSHEGPPASCERAAREMVREGMEQIRGIKLREIKSISASLTVRRVGAVFAAVVLCP